MCDCISKMDEALKDYNTVLVVSIPFDGTALKVNVRTEKLDTHNREKARNVVANFCPFCGEQYTIKESTK